MVRLVLVLGDQLSPNLTSLQKCDKGSDVVVMAEVMGEAGYVPHHPKKIAFTFSAMRKFAKALENDGWQVAYTKLDDPENTGSITGELIRRACEHNANGVVYTEPGEWRLIAALGDMPLKTHGLPDTRFIATHQNFDDWADGRKQLRMEYFYRDMRRKTNLLMDGDKPEGGKWNYDHDNRKPAPDDVDYSGPMQFTPMTRWQRCSHWSPPVLAIISAHSNHSGSRPTAPKPNSTWRIGSKTGYPNSVTSKTRCSTTTHSYTTRLSGFT